MSDLHQDMQFGSWDSYLQAEFEARWTPKDDSRLAYAWSFQYYGYFDEPTLSMINNSLNLSSFLKRINKMKKVQYHIYRDILPRYSFRLFEGRSETAL